MRWFDKILRRETSSFFYCEYCGIGQGETRRQYEKRNHYHDLSSNNVPAKLARVHDFYVCQSCKKIKNLKRYYDYRTGEAI